MREIKFRAWDKEEQEMLDWDKFFNLDIAQVFESKGSWGVYPMQYTGLKDKNGVEIYEGDILKAGDGYIGLIGYRSESAQFVGFNIGNEFTDEEFDTLYTANGSFNSAEVIGNRYENPELLKEEPTC